MIPVFLFASDGAHAQEIVNLTHTIYGYMGVAFFVMAYSLVPLENSIHLRKSKPVLLAAGVIWILVALAYAAIGKPDMAHEAIRHSLLEYAELFLFLLSAMTYINAMEERNVFQKLRAFLVSRGFSLRTIFWITGGLAFVISPVADNLTTALLMGAVVMAVGGNNKTFVCLACINIVVAANAGGAFSPFGDITTLMVWQKGKVAFGEFFVLLIPSMVNWLVPAIAMNFAISKGSPEKLSESVEMKTGAKIMMGLFLLTIITAVSFHNFLHLPPAAGMMLGLGYLGIFSYYLKRIEGRIHQHDLILGARHKQPSNEHPLFDFKDKTLDQIQQMIDQSLKPAFIIDLHHRITHWNPAIEALTGLSGKEQIGTSNHWQPFYEKKRPALADLVLDSMPDILIQAFYKGKHQLAGQIPSAFEASDFFPKIGEKGKWLSFAAAPLKDENDEIVGAIEVLEEACSNEEQTKQFDIMEKISRAEWDTLLFFYGVILCVGGLGQFGYLNLVSNLMYTDLGATYANSIVGVLSAIVDNIPVMFAVLTMNPDMSHGQWLLVTLTAGVGGSLLAIGSAAGVALMGTARGVYTFGAHLKWTPVIGLGYILSILTHLWLNAKLM
ncbi:MAG: sodium:proton antiporter NhaD [Pseudomonadota bacterium]